jgi:hypothetical protein
MSSLEFLESLDIILSVSGVHRYTVPILHPYLHLLHLVGRWFAHLLRDRCIRGNKDYDLMCLDYLLLVVEL